MAMLLTDRWRVLLVGLLAVGVLVRAGWPEMAHAFTTVDQGAMPSVALVVEPGLTCPDPAALERALASVVPLRVPAAPGGSPVAPGWSVSVARIAEGAAMTLREPGGATAMVRTVAVFPSRCEIAAQAIAIMVERYFRELVAASDAPPPPPPAVPEPAPAGAPVELATARATARAAPADAVPYTELPRWTLGVGAAYWTRLEVPSVAVDARVRVGRTLVLGLGTLLPRFDSEQALSTGGGGQARLVGVPAIAHVAVGMRRGRLGASVGLVSVLSVEKGHTEGIASVGAAWRAVLAAGGVLGAAVELGARLRVAAEASLSRAMLGSSYQVGGVTGAVLEPPAWQGLFALRVEWAIFP